MISSTPGKELSVFLLAAAAKGAIIRSWHFALKLSPSASDIFLFLLVRRPFSATDSNDSGIRISFPLGERGSPVTTGWVCILAKVKKADELRAWQGPRAVREDTAENKSENCLVQQKHFVSEDDKSGCQVQQLCALHIHSLPWRE